MMIRRDVGPAIHREQRERLAVLIFAPDACHAEPAIALQREEPFIEALLRLVGRIGEFVEAVAQDQARSEEHTSELQSLMRISYAVFCLKKKKQITSIDTETYNLIARKYTDIAL